MNVRFTQKPTQREVTLSRQVSTQAAVLVQQYGSEESDAREWPNRDNVENTRTRLLAYISELEGKR